MAHRILEPHGDDQTQRLIDADGTETPTEELHVWAAGLAPSDTAATAPAVGSAEPQPVAATKVDPPPATSRPEEAATPEESGDASESALGGGSGGAAGAGRPTPRRPRPPWNRRRRDLPADPVTGQIDTDALWNARMRVEFTVDLDAELAAFEHELDRVKAAAVQAGATYTDLHRRITFAQEAARLGYTGLAQMQAYVFVGDRLDREGVAS